MPRTESAVMQANPFAPCLKGFRLDFAVPEGHPVSMKTLLRMMALALCMTCADAAVINISGTLTWKVTQPDCTFKLDGAIQNLSSTGTSSGSLKMVLWATPTQFPSRGYAVAEFNMGPVGGGYQIDSFKEKVGVFIPKITGSYYFTIAILEYTTSGWLNRDFVTTGRKRLDNGEFVTGSKWVVPNNPVIDPPEKLKTKQRVVLTVKADEDLDLISSGTHAKTSVTIQKNGKARVVTGSEEEDYTYLYNIGKSTIYGNKVHTGRLYLDPEDITGSSTVTLYFHSPTSGVYKNIEENPDGGSTTWGLFILK